MANMIANKKENIFISETTIRKWGNSQGVRLPKDIINRAGLKENDNVEICVINGIITIRKTKPKHLNLQERLEAFYNKPIDDIYVEGAQEINVGSHVSEEVL